MNNESGNCLSFHPNPFREDTEIEFTLQQKSMTELWITDLSGRVVKRINAGNLPSGKHSLKWSPSGIKGKFDSPGIYICTLKTDQGIISGKMVYSNP
jgi:hypothetical protein